jgi:hypothetical protein
MTGEHGVQPDRALLGPQAPGNRSAISQTTEQRRMSLQNRHALAWRRNSKHKKYMRLDTGMKAAWSIREIGGNDLPADEPKHQCQPLVIWRYAMNSKTTGKSHAPHFLRSLLGAAVLAAGTGMVTTTVSATAVLSGSVGGVPAGADYYETFDSLTPGSSATAMLAGGLTVSFAPDGKAVQGAQSGQYAAPFLSGGNGAMFGGQGDGADATTYLTSGGPNGSTTLMFDTQQKYLGLLWGSVDDYNTLEFFSGGASVASFNGLNVGNSTGTNNCIGGNQGALGTCYVNINFLTGSFDKVVATSNAYAFEFDNVAFSQTPVGVPEPQTWAMFGLGLLLVGSAYRFKGRKAA